LAVVSRDTRADFVTYDMTGSITAISNTNLPVAVGDPISWTLRYDRSIPSSASLGEFRNYQPKSPIITNIVDQKTGLHLPLPPSTSLHSNVDLLKSGTFFA
jgi:hypothetical protein